MKVALIGGTGDLGRGLAVRLSKAHEVLVGSREARKGVETAMKIREITGSEVNGGANQDVAAACDLAVLAIPSLEGLAFLEQLKNPLENKLVVSPIVPMRIQGGFLRYAKPEGSAAEEVASVLKESRVVAALHNVPAMTMEEPERKLDFDVLVACDRREDYDQAAKLIGSIEGLRPLYAGPLAMAREIEGLTPLLLNVAKLNGLKRLSIKFVK
jgi:NADPH-dependent F420 reductase